MNCVIKVNLLKLLKNRGLENEPLRKLAKKMGIDHVSLWKMLNGKPYNLALKNLNKICAYLNCQPGDLLTYRKK